MQSMCYTDKCDQVFCHSGCIISTGFHNQTWLSKCARMEVPKAPSNPEHLDRCPLTLTGGRCLCRWKRVALSILGSAPLNGGDGGDKIFGALTCCGDSCRHFSQRITESPCRLRYGANSFPMTLPANETLDTKYAIEKELVHRLILSSSPSLPLCKILFLSQPPLPR